MKYDYVYCKKIVDFKTVKKINKIINNKHDSNEIDNPAKGVVKTAEVKFIKLKHLKKELKSVLDYIEEVNQAHFGFDLYPLLDNKVLNVNNYKPNDNLGYDWHKDANVNHASDIKLTILLNLSEKKYEGGEFYLEGYGKLDFFFEPGDILVFKSFYLHKVDKIISGERKTLSIWMEGPCLK